MKRILVPVFAVSIAARVLAQTPAQTPAQAPAPTLASATLAASPTQVIEQVLVKVNGDIITKSELEERQIAALRQRNLDPDVLKNDDKLKKAISEVTPQILVSAIDEMLLVQLGREKGLHLSDDQFNKWLSAMRKEQNLDDDKRFQEALKQEGMTMSDIRRNVERQFLIQQVQSEEFGGKLQITEEEARQYYLAHQKEFVEASTVTLREILIEVPTVQQNGRAAINVAQDDEAKKKAEGVRARVAAGEDFAKVAAEVSASASKANGGLIGPIAISELSPDLQKLLDKMKPGEVSEPLRVARGYQVLKLDVVKQSEQKPFDSVRDLVADRVYQERSRTEMRKFLDRVRRQAIIVWKNEELRKVYEAYIASNDGLTNPG
jgi:parvulin-like peptidyl-prolyl isomerase